MELIANVGRRIGSHHGDLSGIRSSRIVYPILPKLAIKRSGRIGDMVMLQPVISRLREESQVVVVSDSKYQFIFDCPVVERGHRDYYLVDLDDYPEQHLDCRIKHRTDLFAAAFGLKIENSIPRIKFNNELEIFDYRDNYIVVARGSFTVGRTWENSITLAQNLVRAGYHVVDVGADYWSVNGVRVGHHSINDLYSLIWGATLVVTPDTGIMHLAGAAGVPFLALYTQQEYVSADPQLRTKYYKDYHVIEKDDLTVDHVFEKVEEYMNDTPKGRTIYSKVDTTVSRGLTNYRFEPSMPIWVPDEIALELLATKEFFQEQNDAVFSTEAKKVTWLLPTLGLGGAEIHTLRLAEKLASRGWENLFVVSRSYGHDVLRKEFQELGHTVFINEFSKAELRSTIVDRKPDIVVQICSRLTDFEVRLLWQDIYTVQIVHAETQCVELENTLIVYTSEAVADQPAQGLMIPNGVDFNYWSAGQDVRKRMGMARNRFVICYCGRLSREKNIDLLLEAASLTDSDIILLGSGEEQSNLEALAHSYGVSAQFRGYVTADKIRNILSSVDCMILPSSSESAPLSILEAMSCGCPVIATKVGDAPVMLEDGECGYLFDVGDVTGLCEHIHNIKTDPRTKEVIVKRARERARQYYSADTMVAAYASVIGSALGEPLVSVIVKAGKKLDKTLKQIIENKYKNLEIIVVGSSDYIELLGKVKDGRITSLLVDGEYDDSSYWSFGIGEALGAYLMFLEDGEEYDDDYISECVADGTALQVSAWREGEENKVPQEYKSFISPQRVPLSSIFIQREVAQAIELGDSALFLGSILVANAQQYVIPYIRKEISIRCEALGSTPRDVAVYAGEWSTVEPIMQELLDKAIKEHYSEEGDNSDREEDR